MTSSGHESIGSFPSMHSLAKASPATSLIAETFTTTEQVRLLVLHKANFKHCHKLSIAIESAAVENGTEKYNTPTEKHFIIFDTDLSHNYPALTRFDR